MKLLISEQLIDNTNNSIYYKIFQPTNKYSKIVSASKPFPRNLSTALIKNCKKSTVVITATDNRKGISDCLKRYLLSVFI